MTDTSDSAWQRLVDLAVFVPVGAAATARESAPGLVELLGTRGRAEVERGWEHVERSIRHVKMLGEVAIAFGLPRLRAEARRRLSTVLPRRAAPARPAAPTVAPAPSPESAPREPEQPRARPVEPDLPIPGYDALSASQVVQRLAGLEPDELAAIAEYESSHRKRRTILGKIDQLTG